MSDAPPYAAIAVYHAADSNASLLCDSEQKVIIFDHAEMAKDFLPILGNGRISTWTTDGEGICFTPIDPEGINRAVVLTPYDIYNLPPGCPVLSETRSIAWKNHVIWTEMKV